MIKPNWFIIIEQWKEKGMGDYGVTFPFLVGALSYQKGEIKATVDDLHFVIREIIENPVDGYLSEIRWCDDIREPVISVKVLGDPNNAIIKDSFERLNENGVSVAFTPSLMSRINLDCKTAEECREKLVNYSRYNVEAGKFSKNRNPITRKFEFGSFTENDLEFIDSLISMSVE